MSQPLSIDYPFHFSALGRTAETGLEDHVRDLIEQFLFTAPGERLNRPEFGSGLLAMTFAPNSPELAVTVQALVQASLQQWLGQLLRIDEVAASSEDATLTVAVRYTVLETQQAGAVQFTRSLAP